MVVCEKVCVETEGALILDAPMRWGPCDPFFFFCATQPDHRQFSFSSGTRVCFCAYAYLADMFFS